MNRKFSTVITLALTGFTVVSLLLILGTLYGTLNKAMVKEHLTQFYADQAEISATLENRLQLLESQLRQLSLNNALRVNLMLGVRNQAQEILSNTQLLNNAADLFLLQPASEVFSGETKTPATHVSSLLAVVAGKDSGRMSFTKTEENRIVCIFKVSIMRKEEHLGELVAVYDPLRDDFLQNRLQTNAFLYWRDDERLVSLTRGNSTRPVALGNLKPDENDASHLYAYGDLHLVSFDRYPQLYYAASSHLLAEKRQQLILKLGVIGMVMLGMAVLVSFTLASKISHPLNSLAEQATLIGGNPGPRFFDITNIQYAEFKKLAEGFNELLRNLIRSQEKEHKAKNFLDAIISTAADPIFVKDGRFRWVILNDAYCHFVGKSREALIGYTDFDLFPEKEAKFFRQMDQQVITSGREHAYESKMTDAHGAVHHIWVKKNLYEDPESHEMFIVGIVRDITRSKQLEAELAKHRDRLTEMVNERTSELMATNEQLVREIEERRKAERDRQEMEAQLRRARQMEAIGTLAGGVAHDLNNILSGIVSYPDLILMEMPEDNPMRKPITIMQRSGKKAAAIVQDLLTLSRRGTAASDAVDLNQLVNEYLDSPEFRSLRRDNQEIRIQTTLTTDLPPIMGSAVHLSKTIMNLTTNALEAIQGAGQVSIGTAQVILDNPISAYETIPAGHYVVLSVSDSGCGIDADDIDRIFEPFFTRKKLGRSGTGLGMAVVWGAVKDHQGYINVKSSRGEGSQFSLYFPAGTPMVGELEASVPKPSYLGNGEAILVVDDMADQREIASAMVRELGYQVHAVDGGETAVEVTRNRSFDLILLDMIMEPGIDGYETYRRISQINPNQRAIITSGFSQSDRVRKLKALGVTTYLKKPYTMEQLGSAMRVELDGQAAGAGLRN